jgi:hypothetical protein
MSRKTLIGLVRGREKTHSVGMELLWGYFETVGSIAGPVRTSAGTGLSC